MKLVPASDPVPQQLEYSSPRLERRQFLIEPRPRLAAALAIAAPVLLVSLIWLGGSDVVVSSHALAIALLAAAHLLARHRSGDIEPLSSAMTRVGSHYVLRLLVLLSLGYVMDGNWVATGVCVGIMLAHDLIVISERIHAGRLLEPGD